MSMPKRDFLSLVTNSLNRYNKVGVAESVKRNSHMNNVGKKKIDQDVAEAVLVDFVNFLANEQGVDYGLYTKDLNKEEEA